MLRIWRNLAGAGLVLSVAFAPALALAERATVSLKDGRVFEGELTEYFPNDHVTLLLANAQRVAIAAQDLASVQVHDSAPVKPEPVGAQAVLAPTPPIAATDLAPAAAPTTTFSAKGKLHFALSAPLLRYLSYTDSGGNLGDEKTSSLQWGLMRAAAVELGYGVSDLIVIGGVLQIDGQSGSTDNSANSWSSKSFAVLIGPKLDLQLQTASRLKPFFGLVVGLNYFTGENKSSNPSYRTGTTTHSTTFKLLARAGVRGFVSDDVSLDLAVAGGFDVGGTSEQLTAQGLETTSEADTSGGFIGLSLGLSVWPDLT